MKAFRIAIGLVMGLSMIWSIVLVSLSNPLWKWGIAIAALCFGLAALGKADYLGMSSLRGRFHVVLGVAGIAFAISTAAGIVFTSPWLVFGIAYFSRLMFIICVIMMFAGLLKQGYSLTFFEVIQVLVVFGILAAVALWAFYSLYPGATLSMKVLVYLSLFLLFAVFSVVRIYMGSSLGLRWAAGALSVMFVTLGDMAMAYSVGSGLMHWTIIQYFSWSVLSVLMGSISLRWD